MKSTSINVYVSISIERNGDYFKCTSNEGIASSCVFLGACEEAIEELYPESSDEQDIIKTRLKKPIIFLIIFN